MFARQETNSVQFQVNDKLLPVTSAKTMEIAVDRGQKCGSDIRVIF